MDAPKEVPKLVSRWSSEPSLDKRRGRTKDGKPRKRKLSKRDIEILKLLHRYRYLPANDIHAWVGGSYEGVRRALNALHRSRYVHRPHQQRENSDANYSFLIYELNTAGATVLQQRGFPEWEKTYHEYFEHELMLNRIHFSLELGIRECPGARRISWDDICAEETMPTKTLEDQKPASLPYEFSVRTKDGLEWHTAFVTADGKPSGRELDHRFLFTPGVEADNHSEPLEPKDWKRSSWKKKFVAYLYVLENEIYITRWGLPRNSLYVPCLFPTVARRNSVMRLLVKMTSNNPSLRKYFLFKTYPTLTSFDEQAPATGHVFTVPFQRVDPYKEFSLKEGK